MSQQRCNAVFAKKLGGGMVAEQLKPRAADLEDGFSLPLRFLRFFLAQETWLPAN